MTDTEKYELCREVMQLVSTKRKEVRTRVREAEHLNHVFEERSWRTVDNSLLDVQLGLRRYFEKKFGKDVYNVGEELAKEVIESTIAKL